MTADASATLPRSLVLAALILPAAVFLAVYVPAAGHGFISDDFGWIAHSRVGSWSSLTSLRARQHDFYRPLVSFTFAVNHLMFGNAALGYGLTNLALALICAGLIAALLRQLDLPVGAAVAGGSLWLLNFHGINMAVLWISGRTALLLVACSVAAALFVLRQKFMLAAACLALALLAKEEAVLLPAILAVWLYVLRRNDGTGVLLVRMSLWLILSAVLVAGYFALRVQADALTPATAPDYYRLTFSPATLAGNLLSYADRAATLPALAVVVAFITLRPWRMAPTGATGVRPRIVLAGVAWLIGGYAITVFLPVRSSLYACFPSVGACLIASEVGWSWWRRANDGSRRLALLVAIVLTLTAAPLHWVRTARWVDLAELSSAVLTSLEAAATPLPEGAVIVVRDDRTRRANVESAFGSMLDDAYELKTGRRMHLWIEPPIRDAATAGLKPPCDGCADAVLTLERDGSLRAQPMTQ